jgi:hypothetical protein
MGAPPFHFVLELLSIPVPSPLALEVIERLTLLWKVHRDHEEALKTSAERNGHAPHDDEE